MKELIDYVNGLEFVKGSKPVSFSFHTEVGNILSDDEERIDTTRFDDKALPHSDLIPPLP